MYTVQKLLVEKMKGVLFLSNVSMKICRHFRNRETRIPAHLQDPYPDTGPLPGYRTPTRTKVERNGSQAVVRRFSDYI